MPGPISKLRRANGFTHTHTQTCSHTHPHPDTYSIISVTVDFSSESNLNHGLIADMAVTFVDV